MGVLSWNLLCKGGGSVNDIRRLIEAHRPDLVLLQEASRPPCVGTQRQWSDLAILRTTPALLGLFSLITIWIDSLAREAGGALKASTAAWYSKQEPTLSDAIAAVRRVLWAPLRPQSV